MKIIKVKFVKNGQATGRAYTYYSPVDVAVGDLVQINETAIGQVVEIDVPEEFVEAYKMKMKAIVGMADVADEEESEDK